MKPTSLLRYFLLLAGSSMLIISSASAADVTWDITPGTVGAGDSAITGGTGTWDTTTGNWTTDAGANNIAWDNSNSDIAIFGGTTGIVTLGEAITVGGITFNTTSYAITGSTLTLASGTNLTSSVGNSTSTVPTIASALSGSNGFTKKGSGWLGLTATTSSLTGNINIEAGTLYTRHEALGSGDIVFTGNSTLNKVYNANSNFTQNITINLGVTATMTAGSFYHNANHAGVLAGDSTTTLNLSLGGNTEIQFNNTANTFTGKLIIGTGGTADNGGRAVFKSLADSSQIIEINNGLLRLASGGTSMNFGASGRQLEMLHNARLDNDSTDSAVTMSFARDLLVKTGNNSRTLILSGVNTGNNTFSGVIGNSSTGTGATNIEKQEGGKWILSNDNTFTGTVTITGGTLVLSGTNSYTGKTSVRSGTLEINSIADLASNSPIGKNNTLQLGYFNTTGTLRYVGAETSTDRPIQINDYTNGTGNTASGIILNNGSGKLTFAAPTFIQTNEVVVANRSLELGGTYTGGANEIQGVIQDIAPIANKAIISVVKRNDASTWILSGNNKYTGNTTISGGTLEIGGTGSLGYISSGGGNYAGTISIASTNSGRLVYNSSATQTLGGVISGAGALLVEDGTLELTNSNTYTGATTIDGGRLAVTGTGNINQTSAINVSAGASFVYNSSTALTVTPTLNSSPSNPASFSGSGNLGTVALTLDSLDDVLAPGNSPGIQTFGANQTWNSFTYQWEIKDWVDSVAGTDFDRIVINGTLDLTGSSYALDILSLTTGDASGDVHNFTETSKVWTILTTSGGITGFDALEWGINDQGFTNSFAGDWSLDQSGNDLVLSYNTVIPEPGTTLLAALGALALLRRKR